MPERRSRLFIFDTVVVSNFALAGRLDLLKRRYGHRGWITTEVLDELARGPSQGRRELADVAALLGENGLAEYTLSRAERKLYSTLLQTLGSGEASCIAAAKGRLAVVATDDAKARKTCADRQIRITGTVGILVAMVHDGELSGEEADQVLETMVRHGFFSPVESISRPAK